MRFVEIKAIVLVAGIEQLFVVLKLLRVSIVMKTIPVLIQVHHLLQVVVSFVQIIEYLLVLILLSSLFV